jgi:uncharacterized lipoprotein YmbA
MLYSPGALKIRINLIMKLSILFMMALSCSLVGCINLKPREDHRKVFTMGALELPAVDSQQGAERGYIARPDLPGYMEGTGMKVRSADGEIRDLHGARWAEPLDIGAARALSHYIEAASGGVKSGFYPWPQLSFEENILYVRFHEFVATDDGRILLSATWEVKLVSGETRSGVLSINNVMWKPNEPHSLVAGMNEALEALATQISNSLKKNKIPSKDY